MAALLGEGSHGQLDFLSADIGESPLSQVVLLVFLADIVVGIGPALIG